MRIRVRKILGLPAFLLSITVLVGFTEFQPKPVNMIGGGFFPADTNNPDSTLPYPIKDGDEGGLYLNNPSNYTEDVEYDPETNQYIVTQKIGDLVVKPPMLMSPEEYREYIKKKQTQDYWQSKTQSPEAAKAEGRDPTNSLIPQIQVNSEFFNKLFGSNTIDIRPQGYAELKFGGRFQKIDNPLIPERNRSTFTFDFDQRIQMNVTGKIGDKMKISTNYDTEATFSFENQMKLEYTGDEDDIVKKIELGNVSLPLNSTLISGAQSLFGVKGQFQFGKLTLTGVFSEQRSQSSSINIQGGATTTDFEIHADDYEANRHYFLAQYFRDHYEQFLANRPLITSPVQITKVEVWVTNTRQSTEDTRNIVAFMDLGEPNKPTTYRNTQANHPGPNIFGRFFPYQGFPDNKNNALDPDVLEQDYPGMRNIGDVDAALSGAGFEESVEYTELTNARKLKASEFTYNPQLGYISLNTSLNQDEVLAVAFQFTAGGKTYQVGEFSTDGVTPPKNLVVKMLKSPILNVNLPMWDLMMKNIYSLNAYQVNSEDFNLQVLYQDDETGTAVPFLKGTNLADQLLLRVTGLDELNTNNDPYPDGFFDFINGITINAQNGRIIFPVLEPFGSDLAKKLNTQEARDQYVFQDLYDSTRFKAQNETQLNKFLLKGQFKSSSSSEISLNAFNIPQGSVTVTAGGQKLVENQDYTVDYNLGRVKIINEGILNSGMPIKVDFENNALFNFQTKSFMGLNADYRFNENFDLGATLVRLSERPLTQKVNIGDEPIANTVVGMNGSFSKDAPYLTRFVDAIPFIETKAKSNISVQGEVAKLIPGSPRGIKMNGEETTYLDDFESSQNSIDIKGISAWRLASIPGGQPDMFPEASYRGIKSGFNRALLAWYQIDNIFHSTVSKDTPDNISNNPDMQSDPYSRLVLVKEIFPDMDLTESQPTNVGTLDMAFYPNERGPYNYDVDSTDFSDGLDKSGHLNAPATRWGGIMRDLSNTNFEEQNIEFIQFWVMDPYVGVDPDEQPDAHDGDLYINLGSVSEDILNDGQMAVENGIPADGDLSRLDSTSWGLVPKSRPTLVAFDNNNDIRNRQDVGYDLLNDDQERIWKDPEYAQSYLERIANDPNLGNGSPAYTIANNDPAGDDFQYYKGSSLDAANATILERYKYYNNTQGNSNTTSANGSAYAAPDLEDINGDQTESKTEAYYQYHIRLDSNSLNKVGQNYITDIRDTTVKLRNNKVIPVRWIQFKIPVFTPDKKVGPISDFRSIRFIRMFMKNCQKRTVLRFAKLELIRGEWRRYAGNLDSFGDEINGDNNSSTSFEVNAVNIEQNASREPIHYVIPPGIDRQVLFGTTSPQQQNEQALSMKVCNLQDGSARAIFRNFDFDMRTYKRLKMFVHAEAGDNPNSLHDGDIHVFIRMGSDYNQNYYEYELPLTVTPWGHSDPDEVWPSANNIDLDLNTLKKVKLERDRIYHSGQTSNTQAYSVQQGDATITVKGAPNLSNVRTVMIGIRNPRKRSVADNDPGTPECAEVWINELRLSGFDNSGGWAANARVAANLADFGTVSVSGNMSTAGWGSIDQNVSERQKENIYAYNIQTNFELGKFFSKDFGMHIPVFYSTSEEWHNPQFNPLDPDIEFKEALANLETDAERQQLKEIAQDYTSRKSFNLTNVRKEKASKKKHTYPWDISNFSASYSFNEVFRRNVSVVEDRRRDYKGSLNYTFRTNPKPVEPFKKVGFLQKDYMAIIRDFNFNWYPRSFTAIGTLIRSTDKLQMRNTDLTSDFDLPVTYNNAFTFDRQYSLLYDISKSLKLDFNANMRARIDELIGDTIKPEVKRDYIIQNLKDFGRPTHYHQTVNINWQVPINKLPLLDFAGIQAQYNGDYDWQASSLITQKADAGDSLDFGNVIQNNQQIQLNGNFNLTALYNHIPYLKKINNNKGGNRGRDSRMQRSPVRRPGQSVAGDQKDEEKETTFDKILATTTRTLMMIKNASANYSRGEGTLLPGFQPQASILGMDDGNGYAPGFLFTVGDQSDIRDEAVRNNWLTKSSLLSTQYSKTYNQTMDFRITAEPVENLRIILTAQQTDAYNYSEFFRWDDDSNAFRSQNPFRTENFTTSFITLSSAFEALKAPEYTSQAYQQFLANREIVSSQLADQYAREHPDYTKTRLDTMGGYKYFSYSSQQVLITSFLSAYSGKTVNEFGMDIKKKVPLPNWQVTYDGLTKISWFKKIFNSFVVNHSYRSSYSISNISTNLLKQQALQDNPDKVPTDNNGDLLPDNQIASVVISEQFAPLIGFNTKLKNNATLRLEYKKDRTVALSLSNAQITETKGSEWVIGAGYIIKNVRLQFVKLGPRRTTPVSNLELKADVGIRDNITVIRRVVEELNDVTAGQKIVTVKLSGDYQISQRVQAQIYYDLNLSRYKTSTAYPITTNQFGISVRLNLGQ